MVTVTEVCIEFEWTFAVASCIKKMELAISPAAINIDAVSNIRGIGLESRI